MSTKIVSGSLLCPFCPQVHIELGRLSEDETVSIPTALRRIIGRGPRNTLRLECGHNVYVLPPLRSAQEEVTLSTGETIRGKFPLLEAA